LEKNGIEIREAIIFGSFVKGTAKEWRDIDIALVSPDFTGDRLEDRRRIATLEPLPFRPEDFYDGGMLVEEIKRTGRGYLRSKSMSTEIHHCYKERKWNLV